MIDEAPPRDRAWPADPPLDQPHKLGYVALSDVQAGESPPDVPYEAGRNPGGKVKGLNAASKFRGHLCEPPPQPLDVWLITVFAHRFQQARGRGCGKQDQTDQHTRMIILKAWVSTLPTEASVVVLGSPERRPGSDHHRPWTGLVSDLSSRLVWVVCHQRTIE